MNTLTVRHDSTHPAFRNRVGTHARAVRHTARVRLLRKLVPALAAGLGAAFIAGILLDPRTAIKGKGDVSALGINGAAITMQNPKLAGFNKDRRSYEVTARRADQSIADPNKISLSNLTARIQTEDNSFAQLLAPVGRFDVQSQQLVLSDTLTITSTKGDEAHMADARVDLKEGRISTSSPVNIAIGNTRLSANSMEISGNGDRIIFDGRVRMMMKPRENEAIALPPPDMLHTVPENIQPDTASPEGALP